MKIYSGLSHENRISFDTKGSHTEAIRQDDGTITFIDRKKDTRINAETIFFKIVIILGVIKEIFSYSLFWYVFSVIIIILFQMITISMIRSDKNTVRNHGAEHMVFNAYNKLKRIPTIHEAASFSRISRFCGTNFYSAFIFTHLISLLVYILFNYHISEMIIFFIAIFSKSLPPICVFGLLAQYFSTQKPENENLELAIAALTELERIEKTDEKKDEIKEENPEKNISYVRITQQFKRKIKRVLQK